MNETETIVFGSTAFWDFYDMFCGGLSIAELNHNVDYPLAAKMHEITRVAHLSREIHHLSRSERGWQHHHAWLSLKTVEIPRQDDGGPSGLLMRAGDVIVVEHQWDRDLRITHSPPQEMMHGYLLSGKWEPMIGLFLPLFDKETIMRCIYIRLHQNIKDGYERAEKEACDWGWY